MGASGINIVVCSLHIFTISGLLVGDVGLLVIIPNFVLIIVPGIGRLCLVWTEWLSVLQQQQQQWKAGERKQHLRSAVWLTVQMIRMILCSSYLLGRIHLTLGQ